jgi:hypothetical protein
VVQFGSPGWDWEKDMRNGSSSVAMARRSRDQAFEVQTALAGFLTGYSGDTRLAYQQDLRQFVAWGTNQNLDRHATCIVATFVAGASR